MRILYGIIALLVCGNFVMAWFVFVRPSSEPSIPDQSSFIDPFRGYENQEDLIINVQPLREAITKYEAKGNVSIYFEYLKTGANIAVQKDAQFWPASLLKLPVAMAVAKMVENGAWDWDDTLALQEEDRDGEFGTLYKLPAGTKLTVEELVRRMLIDSDNTAYRLLFRKVGAEQISNIYTHVGLTKFFSDEGEISAKRYSVLLRALYTSSYLKPANSEKLLSFLAETPFREYLGSGMPASVRFSHKLGLNDSQGVVLDSGIVYVPNRPYLLTVMVRTRDLEYAKKVMKEVSQLSYDYISSYRGESIE